VRCSAAVDARRPEPVFGWAWARPGPSGVVCEAGSERVRLVTGVHGRSRAARIRGEVLAASKIQRRVVASRGTRIRADVIPVAGSGQRDAVEQAGTAAVGGWDGELPDKDCAVGFDDPLRGDVVQIRDDLDEAKTFCLGEREYLA
jgi:hypothetical protein